jgi:hypothetical protein
VATGAAWLKGRNSQGEKQEQNILTGKEKKKNILDTHRPSHGRRWVAPGIAHREVKPYPGTRLTKPFTPRAGLDGLIDPLLAAQHLLEMFRRTLPNGTSPRRPDRVSNRLTKIVTEARKLGVLGIP